MSIFDAIGGVVGAFGDASSSKAAAQRQYHKEKEFAQNSILWRVEDANRAGIHPLYAMGNPGISAGPSPYGGSNFSQAGQNIGRAIDSMRTKDERLQAVAADNADRALNRARQTAEIQLLEQQTLSEKARREDFQRGPPSPKIGASAKASLMGDAGVVDYQPNKVTNSSATEKSREPGAITGTAFERRYGGSLAVVPSADIKNRIEDTPMDLEWMYNNKVKPLWNGQPTSNPSTKEYPLKPGWTWRWVPAVQGFLPYNSSRRVYQYKGRNLKAGSAFGWPTRKGNN